MQRSPSRKSSRLQTATSQNVNSSTPAGTNSLVNVSQMPSVQNVSSVALGTTVTSASISAPREPTPAVSTQNIFSSTSEEPFSLPPLVPGPNVRTQPPQTISSDNENLQRQIDILQAQLANAQRALRANQNLNTPNVIGHNAPVIQSISSGPENMVDRRNPTPYSYVSQSDQLMTSQPLIVSPATVPMPVQRKLYDLPEFCGTPEDWPMFLSALEHSTAAYSYNNFENCLRLQKALKGEARECVKSLLIHPNNVPTVIEQLKLQYGRPELLIRCQLQQMKEVQPIAENAIDKLVPYSIKVRNLAAFLESANGYQHLSNPTLMEELVQKLPMSKRLDWAQFASTLPQLPTILDYSTWLQRVANLVRSVQISSSSGNRSSSDPKRKVVLYASDGPERQLKCFYCVGPHKIFDCKKFLELSVPNRWSEVKRLKLCFSCLSGGHSSKDCRRRKQCPVEKCQRNHNKLLHETKPKEPSERSVNVPPTERTSTVEPVLSCVSSVSERSDLLFRVLPVVLYGPNCAIETYALLDEGSSVTMMDSSLVRQLGLHGRQSQLNLSWYGGKSAQEPVMVVDLHVSGVNKKRKYALKNVYGVSNLKLPSQSFNADLVKNHGVPLNSYECVAPKVLIGLDHCHLGLPDEIVPLEDAGPYAANTPLGWVVFGNVKGGRPGTQTCLLTQLDNLNNLVANYFETENFGVKALPVIESRDDLRAREILRNSTKRVAGRFESRLLWCNDDVVLPDSYSMALNRFFGMERKMKNNPEFGAAYKQIMSEYLQKRYVRKLSLSEVDTFHPRTWYLPHFGVVNPNKPGKIRMVFDAAAKVEGVSLNSKLLKGPQQYKSLPSVLFNFRIGSVAVCGDIKEMFHQVVVAEEDRCSQRFLWRDDASGPPEVYEMLVMTFGAACSPCIAHYVKEIHKVAGFEMLRRHSVLWDEMLPIVASLQAMWNKWRQELRNVVHVKVPRFYFGNGLPLELELHIFVDASEDVWKWLPTVLNVADDTTRAENKVDFSIETRWFQGPQFLYENEADWPNKNSEKSDDLCEEELRPKFVMLVSTNLVIDFNRFSSFLRLKRTMAWVLRFINRCRKYDKCNGSRCLCAEELRVAETSLCRLSQEECFAFEINVLKSDGSLKKDNVLFSLSPYFDENNLLRVSGRIDAASWLPLDARHPIILSPCHRFTQLFVAHVHNKMRHQNFEATIGEIRKRFWIPRLRNLLSKTTSNCNICKIRRAVPVAPFMGSLPSDRLTPYVRPFTYTGVDYFGPLNVTVGRRHEKRWVALFTCLTIRAVHLEVAYDLSTDSCILAIRNFINRRGTPLKIRSDNGKNFVGVNQEAQRFDEVFDLVKIEDELSTRGIEWQFNCPHNPAEGGIWERMVQCVKKVLRVTLKEVAPKEHTLQSFLIEAENIVNSRPLTHLPVSPEDEEPLTPNHFLLGSANTAQTPEGIEIIKPVVLKKQWRIARQLRDHFWKRWIVEYLPTLTRRSKWCEHTKPVAPGDLVLICDPAVSRRDWKRGRVVNVFPGSDGVIRRADVQTSSGILKRPVSKLAVLDLE
ncbi:uncharacterized protein LOC135957111 [Calliphora vicina]|uniref:uncharacterized protein LOC135957111 n=1 Tax=Calliphora vicina TaxID=7373 RepID=UPI00325BBBE8